MKILSPQQLHDADAKTIDIQNITSWQLMERASLNAVQKLKHIISKKQPISILVGCGNNGGDGLAIAHHLNKLGYTVEVYLIKYSSKLSPDGKLNLKRLQNKKEVNVYNIDENSDSISLKPNNVIIDAIFGIGLNRNLPDFVQNIIKIVNQSNNLRVAIDVPSGLFLNQLTPKNATVFEAHHTLTFQCPKLNFFLPDYGNCVGEISVIDIGLDQSFISNLINTYEYVDTKLARSFLKIRKRFSHKGNYGHLLLIGGQYGMMGSVCLASKASLKSGAGKVSVLSPQCGVDILQTSVPEAMVISAQESNTVTPVDLQIKPDNICIGMGLGQSTSAFETLKFAIQQTENPMLIDADGLNIMAQNTDLLKKLPSKSILTPHQGELKRLIGEWHDEYEKLDKMKKFVRAYDVILVAKDAYTFVVDQDKTYINSTGNSGMATAGSGDTLSGIISGLLVQNYSPIQASILGVYMHGKAGDLYTQKSSKNSLIASDIIDFLGDVFI